MPTYDYICEKCQTRFDVFMTYAEYGAHAVTCVNCGSDLVRRRPPRVRVLKSDEAHAAGMENELGDIEGLEDDPRALGKLIRKMGRELGDDKPAEFNDVVERLEAGQSPDEIESALPHLGGEDE